MEKSCTTHVWICLISSTQGICINRITIWCSNNSYNMKCTHVNFWYPDTGWGPLLQYSIILAASLFLVCVVLSRNCYACFIVFFVLFVFRRMFLGFCLRMLSVCDPVCVPFLFCRSFPWSTISSLFCSLNCCSFAYCTKTKYWCIFFMLWNLSPVVSSSKIWLFFNIYLCI